MDSTVSYELMYGNITVHGDDGMRYALLRLQSNLYDKVFISYLTSLFAHNICTQENCSSCNQ